MVYLGPTSWCAWFTWKIWTVGKPWESQFVSSDFPPRATGQKCSQPLHVGETRTGSVRRAALAITAQPASQRSEPRGGHGVEVYAEVYPLRRKCPWVFLSTEEAQGAFRQVKRSGLQHFDPCNLVV